MIVAVFTIAGLATLFGLILGYSAIRFRVEGDPIADQIDALLPQTQCGQCSFAGCRPYAEAIAAGDLQAINYFIAQKYVEALSDFATGPNQKTLLLPMEASGILSSLAGITEVAKAAFKDKE